MLVLQWKGKRERERGREREREGPGYQKVRITLCMVMIHVQSCMWKTSNCELLHGVRCKYCSIMHHLEGIKVPNGSMEDFSV